MGGAYDATVWTGKDVYSCSAFTICIMPPSTTKVAGFAYRITDLQVPKLIPNYRPEVEAELYPTLMTRDVADARLWLTRKLDAEVHPP